MFLLMTVETYACRQVVRRKPDFSKVVAGCGRSDVPAKLATLECMDPISAAILAGAVDAKSVAANDRAAFAADKRRQVKQADSI